MKKSILPANLKLGSNTGNAVFFRGQLADRFSKEDGFYGVITGWSPASNYNCDARYFVDVCLAGSVVSSVSTNWGNLSDKF